MRLDWDKTRRYSKSVTEFSRNLMTEVRALPPELRARAMFDTLRDIDPELEQRISDHVQSFVDRGADPAAALEAVLTRHLLARRAVLFRGLFNQVAKTKARQLVDGVMAGTATRAQKAKAFDEAIRKLTAARWWEVPADERLKRFQETGFDQQFIDWAMTVEPQSPEDIAALVQTEMNRGVPERQAMYTGALLAIREFFLGILAAVPIASGPDFCAGIEIAVSAIAGIIVSAVTGAASIALGIAGIAMSAKQKRETRKQLAKAQREARDRALTIDEVRRYAETIALDEEITTEEEALAAFIDVIRTLRLGRDEFVEDEEDFFRRYWTEAHNAAEAYRAQVAAAEELARARQEANRRAYTAEVERRTGELITGAAAEQSRRATLSVGAGIVFPLAAIAGVGALYFLTRQ